MRNSETYKRMRNILEFKWNFEVCTSSCQDFLFSRVGMRRVSHVLSSASDLPCDVGGAWASHALACEVCFGISVISVWHSLGKSMYQGLRREAPPTPPWYGSQA